MPAINDGLDRVRQAGIADVGRAWRAALYIRLSREDGNDESYSVTNQRQRLGTYLEKLMLEETMELAGLYIDDGRTGTDSDREGFQRLLADIGKGDVTCVIVKDLSRLSRNDWECKRYLQHLFVLKNIRFISLELPRLDSYKNPDEVYELGVSIQSLYNENHCRETSIKVRGTFDAKRRRGEFIGAFAPYGYIKDPDDRHRLLIDEQAARVVRDIFHWFVYGGMSKGGIVKKLTLLGIPSPAAYKWRQGMKYRSPALADGKPLWSANSVTGILTNQMYLGHMVQGKQKVKSYKVHARVSTPPGDWFIVKNAHEPIVDEETFRLAGELLGRNTRVAPHTGRLYLFSGFLRCADCGRAMGRRTSKSHVYYACKTHMTQGLCSRHSMRHDKLEKAVLEAVRMQIALMDDMPRLLEEMSAAPSAISSRLPAALKLRKQELEGITALRADLYLDWKRGDITREEYHGMKKEFAQREARLGQDIAALEKEEQDKAQDAAMGDSWLDAFAKHKNVPFLDRGVIAALIRAIHIHEGGGLTIDFRFADRHRTREQLHDFEVPPAVLS